MVSFIFSYLDRHYIKIKKLLPLEENGFNQFYNIVFIPTFNLKSGLKILLEKINDYRETKSNKYENKVRTYIDLIKNDNNIYDEFSKYYISNSIEFYKNKIKITDLSIKDYLNRCEEIIKNEKDNLFNIKQNTINELLILIYKDLIYQFSNDIISNLDNGFLINLKNNNVDNISQLYRLFVNNTIFWKI